MARPSGIPRAYSVAVLQCLGTDLFVAAGMERDKAETVARLLVLTDAMGRRTHGLAMADLYLKDLAKGALIGQGAPTVLRDNGISAVWDGNYLPGLWLVNQAIEQGMARAAQHGLCAFAIRKSHHIGCLAALTQQAADHGFVALIANSDPSGKRVAPYGGTEALFTPNPIAMGYPAGAHPVLVDMCASITTTSMTRQKVAEGQPFDHPWLLDHTGQPTTDARVLEHTEPRGSLQLVGGLEYGHKGFGLALMIEALSQGLAGHGRADAPTRWGGNVFVQVIDPELFGGRNAFETQTRHLADRARANRPIDPARPVRLPGDQAYASQQTAAREGIHFDARVWAMLAQWAQQLGVNLPAG